MRILSYFALLLLVAACGQEEAPSAPTHASLSGTISHVEDGQIRLYDLFRNVDTITLAEDGSFSSELEMAGPGYYMAIIGSNRYNLFLAPGDELQMTADGAEEGAAPSFSGPPAEVQNYLQDKSASMDRLYEDFPGFASKDETAFRTTVDSLEAAHRALLSALEGAENFQEIEGKNLEIKTIEHLSDYENMHAYFTDNDDFSASEEFAAAIPTIDMDNEGYASLYSTYHALGISDFQELLETHADSTQPDVINMLTVMEMKESPSLRRAWLSNVMYYFDANADDPAAIRDALLAATDDPKMTSKINEKYASIMKIRPGSPSPSFTYYNHDGTETSLEELAGKYVYVDVWATWCGPCIGEIPSLKEVEADYHDKNIEFVSISIDDLDDKEKWEKFVVDRELGGVQLFSDNSWQSKFITDYAIEGIPRFILIDPEGKIVTPDAMRPSNPELREQFDELGVK